MSLIDTFPENAIPTRDCDPKKILEQLLFAGRWHEIERSKVLRIPETHPLRGIFRVEFVIVDGNVRWATAMKHREMFYVEVLGPSDFPSPEDYDGTLNTTLLSAERDYHLGF